MPWQPEMEAALVAATSIEARPMERALRALPAVTVIDQAGNDLGPMPDAGF